MEKHDGSNGILDFVPDNLKKQKINKYEKYIHHGGEVWVRSDLKGTHRENCLCWSCERLNIKDVKKNCKIAKALFKICVKFDLVTPVFECPIFKEKKGLI